MFDDEDFTTEWHERRIKRCRSCRARIIWFRARSGKNVPVDADSVEPEDTTLDLSRHVSHFATCPNAAEHRRGRER